MLFASFFLRFGSKREHVERAPYGIGMVNRIATRFSFCSGFSLSRQKRLNRTLQSLSFARLCAAPIEAAQRRNS